MNACGDSRLRGLRSRKPIGFRQWVVHLGAREDTIAEAVGHSVEENVGRTI